MVNEDGCLPAVWFIMFDIQEMDFTFPKMDCSKKNGIGEQFKQQHLSIHVELSIGRLLEQKFGYALAHLLSHCPF